MGHGGGLSCDDSPPLSAPLFHGRIYAPFISSVCLSWFVSTSSKSARIGLVIEVNEMDEHTRKKLLILLLHMRQLALVRAAITCYFSAGFYKEASLPKLLTGEQWMHELLSVDSDPQRCIDAFRMDRHLFLSLCNDLETNYGLRSSNVSIIEKVGNFLFILARGASNRTSKERFQHSGETINRIFHEVLEAVVGRRNGFHGLAADVLKPRDPEFNGVPTKIMNSTMYYPYFENCIGAIDGTHISACVPDRLQKRFRNRKGFTSFNVMAACDFDLCFTYVCAGWEGSAHDSRVLNHALSKPELKFPHPPPGKFYLVDKGYPDKDGFLTPYPKLRYHLDEFTTRRPVASSMEAFNRVHSSLRSCVERGFGVLKQRWQITTRMPAYSLETQTDITLACFAMHNYVRRHSLPDYYPRYASNYPRTVPEYTGSDPGPIPNEEQVPLDNAQEMRLTRDNIAIRLWNERYNR